MESLREITTHDGGDGLGLGVSRWSARYPEAPRLLALHGFIGSGADFQALAEHLGGAVEVVAPDLLGHGASPVPQELAPYELGPQLDRLDALLDGLPPRPTVLLGYSMGGRMALHWALRVQARLEGLVLVSATPGLRSVEERTERRVSDEALARRIEQEGVERFLEEWYRKPIIASQAQIPCHYLEPMLQRRQSNRARGLAQCLRAVGQGALEPLWGRLGELRLPTLLVTGDDDEKYGRLACWMNLSMSHSWHQSVPSAGHCPHIEAPAGFAQRLLGWLEARSLIEPRQPSVNPGV